MAVSAAARFLTHTAPYYVGSVWMLWMLWKILSWVYVQYIRTNDLRKYRRNGAYAIITGCTDGIGKGFAQELAKLKFNLFLISRSQEKLLALQTELESQYRIQTQIFQADASFQDETVYKTIGEKLASIPVTLLVNNVGISTDYPMPVAEMDPQIVHQMIHVNCSFPTRLTQVVVPHLRKHPNGCIINVASIAGVVPAPLLSVYSATKAYNRHFSNAIGAELAQYGIDVLAITPNLVESNMSKMKAARISVCSASRCATGSINKVGLGDASPYWYHSLEQVILSNMPVWIRDKMTLHLTNSLRKHALKKLAQKQQGGDKKSR